MDWNAWNLKLGQCCCTMPVCPFPQLEEQGRIGVNTREVIEPTWTYADAYNAAYSAWAAGSPTDYGVGTSFFDYSTDPGSAGVVPGVIRISTSRYRWAISLYQPNDYCLIQWDEAFFPSTWDSSVGDVVYSGGTVTLTPKSYEWTGGDPYTPWSTEFSIPSSNGFIEIRNMRYTCYPPGSRYGVPVSIADRPWPPP